MTIIPDPRSEYMKRTISTIPPDVKEALLHEAEERDRTAADVAVELVAGEFGETVQLRGQRWRGGSASSPSLEIWLPEMLNMTISAQAKRLRTTESGIIIGVLASHYGLPYTPPRRGRKKDTPDE